MTAEISVLRHLQVVQLANQVLGLRPNKLEIKRILFATLFSALIEEFLNFNGKKESH